MPFFFYYETCDEKEFWRNDILSFAVLHVGGRNQADLSHPSCVSAESLMGKSLVFWESRRRFGKWNYYTQEQSKATFNLTCMFNSGHRCEGC